MDLRYVLSTGENPTLEAQYAAKHPSLAEKYDIPVGIGAEFPDYIHRALLWKKNAVTAQHYLLMKMVLHQLHP